MESFNVALQGYPNDDNNCENRGHLKFLIGLVYRQRKQFEEALQFFTSVLGLLKIQEPRNMNKSASCLFELGLLYTESKQFNEASNMLIKALELRREMASPNDKDVADLLKELGHIDFGIDKMHEASRFYTEASDLYKQLNTYDDLIVCLSQIGSIYLKGDKLEKSLQFYQSAWSLYQDKKLEDEIQSAIILYGLGFIYNQTSRPQEAMAALKQCLKIRLRHFGKQNLDVANTCEQMRTALVSLSRYEDALKVCTTSLEIFKQH